MKEYISGIETYSEQGSGSHSVSTMFFKKKLILVHKEANPTDISLSNCKITNCALFCALKSNEENKKTKALMDKLVRLQDQLKEKNKEVSNLKSNLAAQENLSKTYLNEIEQLTLQVDVKDAILPEILIC